MFSGERIAWDRHHLWFNRKDHDHASRFNRALRRHPGMIIPLPVFLHRELHQEVRPVPVPSQALAEVLLRDVDQNTRPGVNTLKTTLSCLETIIDADCSLTEQAIKIYDNVSLQAEIMGAVYV